MMDVYEAMKISAAAYDKLCGDPFVWRTHGCPSDEKMRRIIETFALEFWRATEKED